MGALTKRVDPDDIIQTLYRAASAISAKVINRNVWLGSSTRLSCKHYCSTCQRFSNAKNHISQIDACAISNHLCGFAYVRSIIHSPELIS